MNGKASLIVQEMVYLIPNKGRFLEKHYFSVTTGNSALSYANVQLNPSLYHSLIKPQSSLRHKIPQKLVTSALPHDHDATASQRRLQKIKACAIFHV